MYSDNKGNKGNSITDHSFTKMVHNHQRFVKFFILYFLARVTLSKKEVKTEPGGRWGLLLMAFTETERFRPKRGIFLRLQVFETVGISLAEKKGNLSFGYVKVPKRANR